MHSLWGCSRCSARGAQIRTSAARRQTAAKPLRRAIYKLQPQRPRLAVLDPPTRARAHRQQSPQRVCDLMQSRFVDVRENYQSPPPLCWAGLWFKWGSQGYWEICWRRCLLIRPQVFAQQGPHVCQLSVHMHDNTLHRTEHNGLSTERLLIEHLLPAAIVPPLRLVALVPCITRTCVLCDGLGWVSVRFHPLCPPPFLSAVRCAEPTRSLEELEQAQHRYIVDLRKASRHVVEQLHTFHPRCPPMRRSMRSRGRRPSPIGERSLITLQPSLSSPQSREVSDWGTASDPSTPLQHVGDRGSVPTRSSLHCRRS